MFIQETHVNEDKQPIYERMYSRIWGYTTSQAKTRLSFWGHSHNAAGGVAILVNPHSRIKNYKPWRNDLWNQYLCAISAKINDRIFILINVYGPRDQKERRALFRTLMSVIPADGNVIMGGDFNCITHQELDRSCKRRGKMSTDNAFMDLITRLQLTDSLHDQREACETRSDVVEFWSKQHTYHYKLPNGAAASSRLDRWYTSSGMTKWVRHCSAIPYYGWSDHCGVGLNLADPTYSCHIKREK